MSTEGQYRQTDQYRFEWPRAAVSPDGKLPRTLSATVEGGKLDYTTDTEVARVLKDKKYFHVPGLDTQTDVSRFIPGGQFGGVNGKVFFYERLALGIGPLLTATQPPLGPRILTDIVESYVMRRYGENWKSQAASILKDLEEGKIDANELKKTIGRRMGLINMVRTKSGTLVEPEDTGYLPYEKSSIVPVAYLARQGGSGYPLYYIPDSNTVFEIELSQSRLTQLPVATGDRPAHTGKLVSDIFQSLLH